MSVEYVYWNRLFLISISALCTLASTPSRSQAIDCVINPSMTLKIGSPVTTTLASVDVERGQRVKRGQVVAQLESSIETADLALAEARARSTTEIDRSRSREELAATDLSRGERLLQGGNIPLQKIDELRSNFRVAQQDRIAAELSHRVAELEFARVQALRLQKVIRSPVDAIVTQRLLGPGEYVHQDNHILVLSVTSPLHVEVYPPVAQWASIRAGDKARVTMSEPVSRTVTATVSVVDEVFDAASGTFGVRLNLPNLDGVLPAGQRCRVTFDQVDVNSSR